MLLNVSSINTTPVGFHAALNKGFIQSKGRTSLHPCNDLAYIGDVFFFNFPRGLSSLALG